MNADEREFRKTFRNGCDFWTGDDGDLTDLVIERRSDALDILKREYRHALDTNPRAPHVLKPSYVERVWNRREESGFDRRGKMWLLTDDETPFPVFVLHLFPIDLALSPPAKREV